MTLEKAIETLTLEITVNLDSCAEDFNSACKLGIEALKAIKRHRELITDSLYFPLQGETKEECS